MDNFLVSTESFIPIEKKPVVRNCECILPNVWGDYFINNEPPKFLQQKPEGWITQRMTDLKHKVRNMIINNDNYHILQTMEIIDIVQLVGVDYHFKDEINQALNRISNVDVSKYGVHEVALHFRLLRQHGYNVPSDIFNKLKDENGNFMNNLKDDTRGMLSLYNAAYMGTHKETILDEIISFTKVQLSSMVNDLHQPLRKQVELALETPIFRRMKRLAARHYISIYGEENIQNYKPILELAKLDFNLLQSLHHQELKNISLWWKNLNIIKHPSFVRDRLVECYFWILGIYFEPQYSFARMITTKVICLASVMDDIYDNYSTFEESKLLTKAIQRWDLNDVRELPDYMKDYFLKLVATFQEFEDKLSVDDKYRISYLKEFMKTLAKAYFEENEFGTNQDLPTLDDCLSTTLMSSGYPLITCASLVGMDEVATMECFEWATSFPKIVKASALIARFMDDICEVKKDKASFTLQCFMKEYDITLGNASKMFREMVEGAWKDINEEWISPTTLPRTLLEIPVNLSRMMETIYKHGQDGYSNSTIMKDNITLLLVQPLFC